MPKVVIVGSCKYAPYNIIQAPNPFDWKLYKEDHEKAYEKACEIYYPKIRESDEVWIYAPNGIGEHTQRDIDYALSQNKKVLILSFYEGKRNEQY